MTPLDDPQMTFSDLPTWPPLRTVPQASSPGPAQISRSPSVSARTAFTAADHALIPRRPRASPGEASLRPARPLFIRLRPLVRE
jgi:hypothetical protein